MLSPLTALAILIGVVSALIWSARPRRNRRKPNYPPWFYDHLRYDP